MKVRKSITILILAPLLFLVAGCLQKQTTEEIKFPEPQTKEVVEQKIETTKLVINDGVDTKELDLEATSKMTAYDLLLRGAEQLGLEIKTTEYDFGVAIDAIGDKVGGTNNKYWMFYVNGQMAPMAADKQEVKAGDKVEFRFEESSM
jgi:hypothetical protein